MSQDTMDLLKVLAAVLVVFAGSTLVMLYVIYLLAEYGANLPMVGAVPLTAPPELIPLLAQNQVFATLAAVHVTATGIALLLMSNTIDMALLITAKAVTVVITSLIGFAGGHMIFLQLTENTALSPSGLTPAVVALAGYFLLSTALSVQALRGLGNLRFAVAIAAILLGPLLLVWL
ncbi:hypothetical protein SAMN05216456_1254 [Devosia crocina]|uniref:Uncharacterized protein n=1 Tax=Devosia crocina TaxID=429728 RepID=A0A1I7N926_9HYPH|nr:hypothetical protein [Devosia crocina]SFV31170.1 hypothetical protein SAMN05216456_1254 [Devosia crocina]